MTEEDHQDLLRFKLDILTWTGTHEQEKSWQEAKGISLISVAHTC